jgi:hypothetical protein
MTRKYTKWPENWPNGHKIYQHLPFQDQHTKWPQNIPNDRKIDQMATKNTKIFHFKTLYTIWQPFWAVVLFEQILKITKVSQILGLLLFHRTSFVLILTKNWVGPHFRRFLRKAIWSLCFQKVAPINKGCVLNGNLCVCRALNILYGQTFWKKSTSNPPEKLLSEVAGTAVFT